MSKLTKYLNQHIVGNVFDRPSICATYASDRSILKIAPRMVALPETTDDLCKLVRFSNQLAMREFRLPITMRGGGTDKTGAAIGDGVVVSTEKMNHIEEIDVRGRLVRVQPGLTLGALNSALALQGLCLPVEYDPAATIGGLIANCPNDDASGRHGGIYHYVERAEVVLSSGDVVQLAPYNFRAVETKTQSTSFEGALYRRVEEILDRYGDTITDRSMRPFDAAGYANITQIKRTRALNLLPLMFASQGTLGIIADIILRIEVMPPEKHRLVVVLHDLKSLFRFLNYADELDPCLLKIFDERILQAAAAYGNQPELLRHKVDEGWLVLVGFDDRRFKSLKKVQHCIDVLPPGSFAIPEMPDNSIDFEEFQTVLMSFLNDDTSGERLAIADDVYIPHYKLNDFIAGLKVLEETLGIELPLFGSYATSNYNVRPLIDYASIEGRRLALAFLRQYSDLVRSCEGSLTGGSPEGRVKSLPSSINMTEDERQLYLEIKEAFDPHNIFNPGVKLSPELKSTVRQLRTTEVNGIVTP